MYDEINIKQEPKKNKIFLKYIDNIDNKFFNILSLRSRCNMMQTNKQGFGKNIFENLTLGRTKIRLDRDIVKAGKKERLMSMEEKLNKELNRKDCVTVLANNLKSVKSENNLFGNNYSCASISRNKQNRIAKPKINSLSFHNFNSINNYENLKKFNKNKSDISIYSIDSPEPCQKSSFFKTQEIEKDNKKMTFSKMDFVSQIKKELMKSDLYNQKLGKVLQYGRLKKYGKRDLTYLVILQNEYPDFEIKTDVFKKVKHLKSNYEENKAQQHFKVKNIGSVKINIVLGEQLIKKHKMSMINTDSKLNIHNNNKSNHSQLDFYSHKKANSVNNLGLINSKINNDTISKISKIPLNRKPNSLSNISSTDNIKKPDTKTKMRYSDIKLLFNLGDKVKILDNYDLKIKSNLHKLYNDVYERAYNEVNDVYNRISFKK